MDKLRLFEKRKILLYLSADEKFRIICRLSKNYESLIYSGFAWEFLFDEVHD